MKKVEDVPREADGRASASQDTLTHALNDAVAQVDELRRHLTRLLNVQIDRARLGVRDGVFRIFLWCWGALLALTASILGVRYVVSGLIQGLMILFQGRIWAAHLAGGIILLAGLWVAIAAARSWGRRDRFKAMVLKYDRMAPSRSREAKP